MGKTARELLCKQASMADMHLQGKVIYWLYITRFALCCCVSGAKPDPPEVRAVTEDAFAFCHHCQALCHHLAGFQDTLYADLYKPAARSPTATTYGSVATKREALCWTKVQTGKKGRQESNLTAVANRCCECCAAALPSKSAKSGRSWPKSLPRCEHACICPSALLGMQACMFLVNV